jgi:multiple sugar transport system substrate-binding protein
MTSRRLRVVAVAATAACTFGALAACGDGDQGAGSGPLTLWTVEDQADRVEAQRAILAEFTKQTGVKTKLVAVAEDKITTVLSSAAASGDLPDVIGAASLPILNQLHTDDLLDTETAAALVESLGPDTFAKRALELTKRGDEQLGVPSDGWAQLIYYRKDLFDKAGLQPPTTYEAIQAAAEKLDQGDTVGIVAATAPGDPFTHQTFEHVALANGCELTDGGGKVVLDSKNCVNAFGYYSNYYSNLLREHSVRGNQDVDTTRAAYFSGRAAMVVWSSFMLDELAGLRNDALPTCAECKQDKTFLAKNTGIVSALQGPDAKRTASFGEVVSFAVLHEADTGNARRLVEFMMGDGYESWLAIAPEGKVPTRTGNDADKDAYLAAWRGLDAGVDTKAPLSQFYSPETLRIVETSTNSFTRWGFPQGQGELASAVFGQLGVPKALSGQVSSGADPAEAARKAAEEAGTIQEELGG